MDKLDKTAVAHLILRALQEFNSHLPADQHVPISSDTVLFGHKGNLDSLGLVNLILLVEEQVAEEFSVLITLADERALSLKKSPFHNVTSLSEYVYLLLMEQQR